MVNDRYHHLSTRMHGMSIPNRAEEHEHDRPLHGIMLHADITTKSGNAASEPVINVLTLNVAKLCSGLACRGALRAQNAVHRASDLPVHGQGRAKHTSAWQEQQHCLSSPA